MLDVVWSEQSRQSMADYETELIILYQKDAAQVKLRMIWQRANEIALDPLEGRFLDIAGNTNIFYAGCLGGYLIYQPSEAQLQIIDFVRDNEMPAIFTLFGKRPDAYQ